MKIDMTQYRPLPFYFLNGRDPETDYAEAVIDRNMRKLRDCGFGGCILFNSPGAGFGRDAYLSEAFFEVTRRFVLAAGRYGLKIWFTDGWRCPSGDVGGRIEKIDPSLKQRRLARGKDGKIEVLEVPWGFPAFEEPESSALFIELVYEEYRRHLGEFFGGIIEGIFSDADNRRFDAFSASMMEDTYYPWSKRFPETFAAEYGYEITPYLDDIVDGKYTKESCDYFRLCEKLYLQWFKNNYEWCVGHGLKYSFHTSDTGPFPRSRCRRSSVFTEGNPFSFFRYSTYPGTDHELLLLDGGTHFDERRRILKVSRGGSGEFYDNPDFLRSKYDLRAKYVGSAAWLYGKKGGACELFAVTNWGATATEYRMIAAWQLFSGINIFIPHGVAHKLEARSRFVAPPDQTIGIAGCVREVSDFMAKYAFIASQGEYAPGVKVADVTEAVRRGAEDVEDFFTFTDMLTHAGISYVIVPEDTPGAIRTLDGLPPLPEREFTFTGGDLIGMRRRLDGEYFLMVGNIWSRKELSGTLTFGNRREEIQLAPGEIAVIGGPFEEFRAPEKSVRRALPFPAAVEFGAPNRVPFHYNSEFTIATGIGSDLKLLIPARFAAGTPLYDGKPLSGGRKIRILTDDYLEYAIPGTAGRHSFLLPAWQGRHPYLGLPSVGTGNDTSDVGDHQFYLPVYLDGDFDVSLEIDGEFDHPAASTYYILELYAPKRCDVTLSPRRKTLDAGSWAEQGQPFYSGTVSYKFDIGDWQGEAALEAPDAAAKIEVRVDGRSCGATGFAPFRIDLGDLTSAKTLEVVVTNTLANAYEEFRAPSGLIGGASLLRR